MTWWQAGQSKDWNLSLRDTLLNAATSVQRLAEQAELEIKQQSEQFVASAQCLAEQAETSFRDTADKVVSNVSALGLLTGSEGDGLPLEEELVRRFDAEARALTAAAEAAMECASSGGSATSGSGAPLSKAAAETLHTWAERCGVPRLNGGPGSPGKRACSAWASGGAGGFPAARLPLGSTPLRALLRSRGLDAALAALTRTQDGRVLLAEVAQLAAVKGRERSRSASGSPGTATGVEDGPAPSGRADGASDDALSPRCGAEDAADAASAVSEAADDLFALLSQASAIPAPLLAQLLAMLVDVAAEADAAARRRGASELPEGAAAAVGDLGGAAAAAEVAAGNVEQDVAWVLALIAAAVSEADEATLRSRDAMRQAVETALATAGAADSAAQAERAPALAGGQADCSDWLRQLDAAEARGRSFRELRCLCAEFAALAQQQQTPRAWQRRESDSESEDAEAAAAPLACRAESLAALREDSSNQAEELAALVQDCVTANKGFEVQMSSSAKGFDVELDTLRQTQEEQTAQIEELRRERESLQERLKVVDEQMNSLLAARVEAADRERQVSASAKRVREQLEHDISSGADASDRAGRRRDRILQVTAVARDVEAQVTLRSEELAGLAAARSGLVAMRRSAVAAACLEAERSRLQHFEELLGSWHAAIWGPIPEALVRDPARLAMVRGLHMRAGALVEQAWRELEQLGADVLEVGANSVGSVAADPAATEDLTSAAERYKEMRQQLQANLDRLTRLEAALPELPLVSNSLHPPAVVSATLTPASSVAGDVPRHAVAVGANGYHHPVVPAVAVPMAEGPAQDDGGI
eukprot:TRINITY_DN1643_c0_g5_i1.p1 TRINITY_DN1643_c0_g5~~TRINITY_DN1643_c0_g5_i1.p1  ORF type:complete len:821 (+),score=253.68 TRINITY_DN1643_c0_g5_i1:201-2663(+)